MAGASRPLRALALVMSGWTGMRAWALWPAHDAAERPIDRTPQAKAQALDPVGLPEVVAEPEAVAVASLQVQKTGIAARAFAAARDAPHDVPAAQRLAQPPALLDLAAPEPARLEQVVPAPPNMATVAPRGPRAAFSGSSWVTARGGADGLAPGGTLGGSQAGVRLFVEPGPTGVALTARIGAPLSGRSGREASVGIGLRGPHGGVLIERRVALDRGGRNAMSLTAYAGGETGLPGAIKLDGYAQGGVVGARSRDLFADGAIRVERTIVGSGGASLAGGAGAWAGAQPGVARVDVGPQLVAHVAAGPARLRVAVEYRFRIAGDAAPGSGPALSVGTDF